MASAKTLIAVGITAAAMIVLFPRSEGWGQFGFRNFLETVALAIFGVTRVVLEVIWRDE